MVRAMKRTIPEQERQDFFMAVSWLRTDGYRTADLAALAGVSPRAFLTWERHGRPPLSAVVELLDLVSSYPGASVAVLAIVRGRDDALPLGFPLPFLQRLGRRIASRRNASGQSKPPAQQDSGRPGGQAPPSVS